MRKKRESAANPATIFSQKGDSLLTRKARSARQIAQSTRRCGRGATGGNRVSDRRRRAERQAQAAPMPLASEQRRTTEDERDSVQELLDRET